MESSLPDLTKICIEVFKSVSSVTDWFVLPLFLVRVIISSVTGNGQHTTNSFKGVVIYFLGVLAFPPILEILFLIPESVLPSFESPQGGAATVETYGLSLLPFALDKVVEVLLSGVYWFVYYIHVFLMILMSSIAPVVFLLAGVLGIGLGIETFLGLLIIASSWPIIWFGFDQVHNLLASQQIDSFGSRCLELMLTVFKGLAPISFAALAVKSPAGKALSTAPQLAWAPARGAMMRVSMRTSNASKFTSQTKNNSKAPNGGVKSGIRAKKQNAAGPNVRGSRVNSIKDRSSQRESKKGK